MMDREILFRGKSLLTGKWVVGDLSNVVHDGPVYVFPKDGYDSPDFYEVDPATVGQYTGLKDADGNRIFEGDILKSSLGWRFVATWDDENARFLGWTIDGERRIAYVDQVPAAKVVGNIHDNPELLEGE